MALKQYSDGTKTMLAGQISEVTPYKPMPGALSINFGDDNVSTLTPQFSQLHDPKVGDWFVINTDYSGATIMRNVDFAKTYSEVA